MFYVCFADKSRSFSNMVVLYCCSEVIGLDLSELVLLYFFYSKGKKASVMVHACFLKLLHRRHEVMNSRLAWADRGEKQMYLIQNI